MSYILIIVGFTLLVFCANWLVDGASGLAKKLNVPDLIIGLTVVAFGTSAPELMVNVTAALKGTSEIAITNILGSNIINTLVILGFAAVVFPVSSQKSSRHFDIPLSVLAGVAVLLFGTEFFMGTPEEAIISRFDGLVLLAIFAFFIYRSIRFAIDNKVEPDETYTPMPIWKSVVLILVGLVGLILGGNFIVDSAVKIAIEWGVSEAVIGVTIVALGTSLPELVTSVMAAYKKNSDLAIGNVIGSNIFNVFFVLGTSATISPLNGYSNLVVDCIFVTLSSILLLLFVARVPHKMNRVHGAIFLLVYVGYLIWLLK